MSTLMSKEYMKPHTLNHVLPKYTCDLYGLQNYAQYLEQRNKLM